MGNVVLMMSVSLDGFFCGPDGELDWQTVDTELHTHFNDVLRPAAAFLDGRVTYELMAGYWPTADADPAAPAPVAEFAGIWRDMPKVVYSTTLESVAWNGSLRRAVDADEVRRLAGGPGDVVLGGARLAAAFLDLDLVDEYRLYVHPVTIGRGRPLFPPDRPRRPVRLVETRAFGSGVVLLRYGRPGQGQASG